MKCSKCGNKLSKDDLFCTKCGKKVEQEVKEEKIEKALNGNGKEKQKSKKWKIIVPILIILIIITVVGIFIFKKSADNVNEENLQEVSNIIDTDQAINEDILTVVLLIYVRNMENILKYRVHFIKKIIIVLWYQ